MSVNGYALHIVSLLGSSLLTSICCYPIFNYLRLGWKRRKADILSSFSSKAKKFYLRKFFNVNSTNPDADFEALYEERYSKSLLYGPTALLFIILISLMYMFSQTALSHVLINGQKIVHINGAGDYGLTIILPNTAASALVGAYLWIVFDLTSQTRRNDFRAINVLLSALRLAASVPIGYAVASIANSSVAPFVAFAISAFPLDQVRILLRRLASDKLGLTISVDGEPDQVKKISGVDSVVADTLQDVGYTTVPQLAYCDPVQVAIKSGFDFSFVVDIVGQALAWIYFGDKLAALRIMGMRSSVEIGYTLKDARDDNSPTKPQSDATLDAAAIAVGITKEAFLNACDQISEDPYNEFLTEVWCTT